MAADVGSGRPERERIGAADELAVGVEADDDASELAFLVEREIWLGAHAPQYSTSEPSHRCLIALADRSDGASPKRSRHAELQEYDVDGRVCGAWRRGGQRSAFGSAAEVIATVAGVRSADPWVVAVVAALDRDRGWTRGRRRQMLEVRLG